MLNARMVGNFVQQKASSLDIKVEDLSEALNCSDQKIKSFLKGRSLLSFEQLTVLSELLKVPISQILNGDSDSYNETVVHCMNDFDDNSKREMILDIIYNYIDIKDSVI